MLVRLPSGRDAENAAAEVRLRAVVVFDLLMVVLVKLRELREFRPGAALRQEP